MIGGLRAVAVFLVIVFHSGLGWVPGGLGVLMFFVISGFLITWLLLKENARKDRVSLKRFYIRRSLRIFPAFYVYAFGLLTLLWLTHRPIDWPQAIAALSYTGNYYQALFGDPNTGLSHTWSLGIEEQFYLAWPALFVLLRNRPRALLQATSGLIGAVWIYRFILKYALHVHQGYFYEAFDTRMDHLLMGCLLAVLLFHFREHPAWSLICERPLLTLFTIALLVLSTAAEVSWGDRYRDTWGFIVNPLLCALLIPQLISLRGFAFTSWMEAPAFKYLGNISYSLYLYQQVVLEPVRKLVRFAPFPVQVILSIAVLIAVASGSYWLVEKPFLKLKDSRFHN